MSKSRRKRDALEKARSEGVSTSTKQALPKKLKDNPLANRVSLTKGSTPTGVASRSRSHTVSNANNTKHGKRDSPTFSKPPTAPRGMIEKPTIAKRRRSEALRSRRNERSNRDREREEMIRHVEQMDKGVREGSERSHASVVRRTLDIKNAALPPILRVSNLTEGTTAADVRKILEELFGKVKDVRSCDMEDRTVTVEVKFTNADLAYDARTHLDGTNADGRYLKAIIVRINEIWDEPRVVEVPQSLPHWSDGPPLYADRVNKEKVPPAAAQVQRGIRSTYRI